MVGVSIWGRTHLPQGSCQHEVLHGWSWHLLLFLPPSPQSCFTEKNHSLAQYLHCLQHRSCVLWWFLASKFLSVEITWREHKWRESSRSFKTFDLQLCYLTAEWPWKMSQTLRRRKWQPTPVFFLENPMNRGASWATVHGSQGRNHWTNLAWAQACMLSWSSSLIWGK